MRTLLLVCLVATLSGCVGLEPADFNQAAKPTDVTDEFTGTRRQTMTTVPMQRGWGDAGRIFFSLIHDTPRDSQSRYFLRVDYTGYGSMTSRSPWLFIAPGASLAFLIDGQLQLLTTVEGSKRFREVETSTTRVRETADYPITVEICERIAKANNVKVRLSGQSYYVDQIMPPKAQQTFREFAQKFKF